MERCKRIRVVFRDDNILSDSQESEGLRRSWVLLKPSEHKTVSDVASFVLHAFQLQESCPHGLVLSASGFVLPPFESTCILKDDELISVRKKRNVLCIEGGNASKEVKKVKTAGKQPVDSDVFLLANEEFQKEKGAEESENNEEAEEGEVLECILGGNEEPKHRKRKAKEKLQSSKKKRKRSEANDAEDKFEAGKSENSHQGRDRKKKKISCEEKNAVSPGEDNEAENDESAKSRNGKENDEGSEDAMATPTTEKKKLPSRSARRKYQKRQWLKEMKKIQKKNMSGESEGLRNWKEDQAKAKKNQVEWQPNLKADQGKAKRNPEEGQQGWKKHQANGGRNDDGQPKGLLHWIQSPQDDTFVKEKKRGRKNQYAYNKNQGDSSETNDASEQPTEESDEENEVVPVVIKPGHIHFKPLAKEAKQAVQKEYRPSENFQWNGITSKKKGQQWGREKHSSTSQIHFQNPSKVCSEVAANEKNKPVDAGVCLENLPPLTGVPKEGDIIAYRILELSPNWTPELCDFRVGKVCWYNTKSDQILLAPVPEYPIHFKKLNEDGAEEEQHDSLYAEDGSLKTGFSSLIDARIFDNGTSNSGNEPNTATECDGAKENATDIVLPGNQDQPTVTPNQELNQAKEATLPASDIWDQINEALNAKKEQLSKDGWTTPKMAAESFQQNTWEERAKNVNSSPASNSTAQPAQDNQWEELASSVKPLAGSSWGKSNRKVESPSGNGWQKNTRKPFVRK
ncbi:coilin isoform X2 [Andrographis paniculata]|uniref:coilin isoform X2 n=1 Tax=Andrographis paniculata TaxID=175694 RepID=UPI0021E7870B|nr:coilin isoform X2 [Andrographis paniculata]